MDADLVIIGAGPAGVSAAVTAASVGMSLILVESHQVGARLRTITSLENLAGGWSNGLELADALARDVAHLEEGGRCSVERARAVEVSTTDAFARVSLADGRVLTARAVIVATGVSTLTPQDVDWLDAPDFGDLAPLWRAVPADLEGRAVVVLGADRPLGTWLRAHPSSDVNLHVLHPRSDIYKTEEIASDPRVNLEPVEHVALVPAHEGTAVTLRRVEGSSCLAADVVLMNAGSKPARLTGLVTGADGYCPAEGQHPRVMIAGDLKGPRMQRIAVALGDGQRAALTPYYQGALPESAIAQR